MGKAFDAWLKLSNDSLELTAVIPWAFAYVVESTARPDWTHINQVMGQFNACRTYDACKRSVDTQFDTLFTLTLLASWGAFEAYVEDAAKAALRLRPELLSAPAFDKAKRKAADLDTADETERFEFVIDRVVGAAHDKLEADGGGKYEQQLALAGLDGAVPPNVALALMEGQQVRNVWAHNGGRADAKLLEQAPNIDYEIGETVTITKAMLAKYLLVLNTYSTIIVNRYRIQNGFAPLVCYGGEHNEFKAAFDELFPDAILPVNLEEFSRR
ncbi:hypothetical protein SBI67_25775 [Mycolicibacterium sp. 120266]|uniref:hypothetical protein n=1 Tax=Mycolicibacterium sp. 120266 TaxID=3090601 RepID=UPI00299D79AF|nr:hypothetical protein [Mycolicibacterium sp. 120266]MDX1875544.1 hypothetical protein [Mycolicibacterium sp. 120266]